MTLSTYSMLHPSAKTDMIFNPQWLQGLPTCKILFFDRDKNILKAPIELTAEQTQEEYWIITNPQIMTYGIGDTCEQGVDDFKEMLFDYFKELVESEEVLAPNLENQLKYLISILIEENIV